MTQLEQEIQLIRTCLKMAEIHLDKIESAAFETKVIKKYEEIKKDKS
jgi:hypothetical protein